MWGVRAVGATMWRWVVLYLSSLLLVGCAIDFRLLGERRYHDKSQVSCVDYPDSRVYDGGKCLIYMPDIKIDIVNSKTRLIQAISMNGPYALIRWQAHRNIRSVLAPTAPTYLPSMSPNGHAMSRRFDRYFPHDMDLIKEHAKLVQDINSLRQIVFVAPLADESRDYEDSIFPEFIETYTTTTPRPTTTRPPKPTKGIPIILLGGASQRQIVRSQPIKFPKQVINLVGTSVSPLYKHPYPFVMQASSRQPVKICVTAPPLVHTTTRRPSIWERLINSIIPRGIIGASRPNLLPT